MVTTNLYKSKSKNKISNIFYPIYKNYIHKHNFFIFRPEVQATLVRSCWSELFTLGLAQCSQVMSVKTIFTAIISHLQSSVQQGK